MSRRSRCKVQKKKDAGYIKAESEANGHVVCFTNTLLITSAVSEVSEVRNIKTYRLNRISTGTLICCKFSIKNLLWVVYSSVMKCR